MERQLRAAVVTASDKGSRGEREDLSGPQARQMLEEAGYDVVDLRVLPDDKELLKKYMVKMCDEGRTDLIVTTGGTGFSIRDNTPEATIEVSDRLCPGIPEAIRAYSLSITPRAMLSRAQAGIRNRTLIVNLPGSPKAVGESLGYILPTLNHGVRILIGEDGECARS